VRSLAPLLRGRDERSSLLEGWGERGSLDGADSRIVPLTRRYAIAEARLRRSLPRTAAKGGLCSPRKRGEVKILYLITAGPRSGTATARWSLFRFNVFQTDPAPCLQAIACLLDPAQESRIVFKPIFKPVLF